jgi:hypothetical protein
METDTARLRESFTEIEIGSTPAFLRPFRFGAADRLMRRAVSAQLKAMQPRRVARRAVRYASDLRRSILELSRAIPVKRGKTGLVAGRISGTHRHPAFRGQKIPRLRPAPIAAPTSRQRSRSSGPIFFSARICSGVCACVQTIRGGWTSRNRQP